MKKLFLLLFLTIIIFSISICSYPIFASETTVDLTTVKDVYLSILLENKESIDETKWKDHPIISFADITGDSIPEMIYQEIYTPDGFIHSEMTSLKVTTCQNNKAVDLFTHNEWECYAGGMGGYFLFQVENEDTLYVCQLMGGDIEVKQYYKLEENDNAYNLKKIMEYSYGPYNPDFNETIIEGEHVSKDFFEEEELKLIASMKSLLMTDPLRFPYRTKEPNSYLTEIEKKAMNMNNMAMTYDQAITLLTGSRGTIQSESIKPSSMEEAYLKELQDNQEAILKIGETKRNDLNGESYYFYDHAVSFYDITGDNIPELLYSYLDNNQFQVNCKIISYQEDGSLISIKDEAGQDLWISGAANGNSATLFVLNNSDHLFIKTGTIAGITYDNISEYELIDNILYLNNYYLIQLQHDHVNENNVIWTYEIGGLKVAESEVLQEYSRILSNLDKELINKLCFLAYQPEISVQPESISMSYDEAISYLQTLSTQ